MKKPSEASHEASLPTDTSTHGLAGLLMPNAEWQSLPEPDVAPGPGDNGPRRKFAPPEGPMKFPHFVPTGRMK